MIENLELRDGKVHDPLFIYLGRYIAGYAWPQTPPWAGDLLCCKQVPIDRWEPLPSRGSTRALSDTCDLTMLALSV